MAALATISINGGAPVSGDVTASLGDTARFRSATAEFSSYRFELYGFPAAANVSGWTHDTVRKVWYYLGATPPDVTLTPWGDWEIRLLGDGGSRIDQTDESGFIRVAAASGLVDMAESYNGQAGTTWSEDHRTNLRTLDTVLVENQVPATVTESGADATGTVVERNLAPKRIKTTDAGTHDYVWDIGATVLPANCDADALADFTVHLYGTGADKIPYGAWRVSATWSRTGAGSLVFIGQTDITDIDTSAHTYRPSLQAGTNSADDHTIKLTIGAPTAADYHWVITAHLEATYFAGA